MVNYNLNICTTYLFVANKVVSGIRVEDFFYYLFVHLFIFSNYSVTREERKQHLRQHMRRHNKQ